MDRDTNERKKSGAEHSAVTGETGAAAEGVRINKYLSEAGICSRREADRMVEAGEVTIDGVKAKAGDRVRTFCLRAISLRASSAPPTGPIRTTSSIFCTTESESTPSGDSIKTPAV